ncbi:MAG: efflux RND transporter periplasmic adaptor subunit [Anaerolineales bacterium]|nr:efflux RND transporter periplasmic adaptor subunit [Anaerolineales bacterium]
MSHKRPPIPVIIVILLVVIIGGYFIIENMKSDNGALAASGTIEAVEITLSPEMSGKVAEVLVDEGDSVKAGDVLFRLDGRLLSAQRDVAAAALDTARATASIASAALETARAQYELTLTAIHAESAAARIAGWRAANPGGYTLPGWYFTREEEITAAQNAVETAKSARDAAQTKLKTLSQDPASAGFITAETRLINAKAAFVIAKDVLDRASLARDNADLKSAAQETYDSAKTELEDAQTAYDDLTDTDAAKNIITARAEFSVAQEGYDAARDRLTILQTGDYSPRMVAAQAALHQAEAAASQAQIVVAQAGAQLALIDAQIGKLTVAAPADGVVLTRVIQPGEVVAPASSALTLVRLDSLTITVYIPEDRYGEISLGQAATVSVDSFPGETFMATVTHISDKAEFTPRNVQTVEGRKSTVFAIRLKLGDPQGKLKPGMPADVTFKR